MHADAVWPLVGVFLVILGLAVVGRVSPVETTYRLAVDLERSIDCRGDQSPRTRDRCPRP